MTHYDIRIEDVESGLTPDAIRYMVKDTYPDAESITVMESEPSSD
jgi:hypothetical protein